MVQDFGWKTGAEAGLQCTIDVVQAVAYLGQAVVFLYHAAEACPEGDDRTCGVSVAIVLTSFAWIASYVSLAAESCKRSLGSWLGVRSAGGSVPGPCLGGRSRGCVRLGGQKIYCPSANRSAMSACRQAGAGATARLMRATAPDGLEEKTLRTTARRVE